MEQTMAEAFCSRPSIEDASVRQFTAESKSFPTLVPATVYVFADGSGAYEEEEDRYNRYYCSLSVQEVNQFEAEAKVIQAEQARETAAQIAAWAIDSLPKWRAELEKLVTRPETLGRSQQIASLQKRIAEAEADIMFGPRLI